MRTMTTLFVCTALMGAGCDGDSGGEDAAAARDAAADAAVAPDAAPLLCASDSDSECDDGVFCTGVERCMPGVGDARGCVAGTPPCASDERCEDTRCIPADCSEPDADGDGAESIACGGNDCDDHDPRVFGTAQEICDPAGLDEDCDSSTIYDSSVGGADDGDRDGDGHISSMCFNLTADGENRGDDCDDTRPSINPDEIEVCNGYDDDCDGNVDEGVRTTFYRDFDGDGYGIAGDTFEDCGRPSGYALMPGDCDDAAPQAHPGGTEVCGGGDEDCDGVVDEAGAAGQSTFYEDADGDGYGLLSSTMRGCIPPPGFVDMAGDCWDDPISGTPVHPGADFQPQPYCRRGTVCRRSGTWRCHSGITIGCSSTDPLALWDYNRDGGTTAQPAGACVGGGVSICTGGEGRPFASHPTSACGTDVPYISACAGSFSGSCRPVTEFAPLRCR